MSSDAGVSSSLSPMAQADPSTYPQVDEFAFPLCQTSCRLSSFSSGLSAEAINNETTSVFP